MTAKNAPYSISRVPIIVNDPVLVVIQGVTLADWLKRVEALEREVAELKARMAMMPQSDPGYDPGFQPYSQPGITFTDDQWKRINELGAAGDTEGMQKLILDILTEHIERAKDAAHG